MKKTLVSMLLVLVLLIAAVTPAFAYSTYYVKTENGGPLLVREGPGKNYEVISKLSYGAQVGVDHFEGSWARLIWGGSDQAYVMTKYLSAKKPSGKSSSTSTSDSYAAFKPADFNINVVPKRASSFVNMRWAPNSQSKIQAKYYMGDQLHVIAESRNWYQVYDTETNRCGFMMKSYTSIIK